MSTGRSMHGGADIFLLYLEAIGRPDRFRAVADKAAAAGKPLIIAKVGRSDAGRRAAASHTGSLAHAGIVDDAIFRHHGIIRGEDLDHMLDVAAAFSFCKLPQGNRVAVITGSGGSAVWMADILSAHGLELPVLEDDIQRRIMALLPSYASAQNPVDATAQAIHEVGYARARRDRAQVARIDTILLIGSLANEATARRTRRANWPAIVGPTRQADPAVRPTPARRRRAMAAFAEAGIPCYTSMPSCARAIRALVDYARFQARRHRAAAAGDPAIDPRRATAARWPPPARCLPRTKPRRCSPATASRARPRSWRFRQTTPSRLPFASAARWRSRCSRRTSPTRPKPAPWRSASPARPRCARPMRGFWPMPMRPIPPPAIDGVLVQRMAPPGVEIILGITRDPDFGPMLMVGLGGIHVEVLRDVAFAPVPIGTDEALSLLGELKGAALLDGVRGAPPADRAALAELIAALSRFAADHAEQIDEIDLNPVIVHPQGQGLTVVDALIVKRREQ